MPRVLVVDDNQTIVGEATTYLELEGWDAVGASNGKEALELLNRDFDAVVLDLRMPVLDGEATLKEIRRRPELDATCVVILTAFGEVKGAVRALRLGAYQYLEKPFAMPDLHKILVGGIAMQKAHSLRRELLTAFRPEELFDKILKIITDTFRPKGLHILFLGPDGSVERTIDGASPEIVGTRPEFVRRIVEARHAVFEQGEVAVKQWQPMLETAQCLLVAPVMGGPGVVAGVIDLESSEPDAFDRNWLDVVAYLADVVGIALDISKKAEKQLEAERQKAEALIEREKAEALVKSERQKRNQLAQVAQEVRHRFASPAQVIQMQAGELLAKEFAMLADEHKAVAARRLRVIQDNAEAITGACAYLDDLARDLPIQKSIFDLASLLDDCGLEVKPELDRKSIQFSFIGRPPEPVKVHADPQRIRYSVQCLLRNAIEAIDERRNQVLDPDFDPSKAGDGITLCIELSDPAWITFSVQDTGIGIRPEDEARLFQPLFTTKVRLQSGGLGLFSVKRIIDNHNGRIQVASRPAVGTTFAVSLPRG